MIKCPSCGLVNPNDTSKCDCGYPLKATTAPTGSFLSSEPMIYPQNITGITIKDINMPFWSMVGFMVKWAFASIPAMFIIAAVIGFVVAVFAGLGLVASK